MVHLECMTYGGCVVLTCFARTFVEIYNFKTDLFSVSICAMADSVFSDLGFSANDLDSGTNNRSSPSCDLDFGVLSTFGFNTDFGGDNDDFDFSKLDFNDPVFDFMDEPGDVGSGISGISGKCPSMFLFNF